MLRGEGEGLDGGGFGVEGPSIGAHAVYALEHVGVAGVSAGAPPGEAGEHEDPRPVGGAAETVLPAGCPVDGVESEDPDPVAQVGPALDGPAGPAEESCVLTQVKNVTDLHGGDRGVDGEGAHDDAGATGLAGDDHDGFLSSDVRRQLPGHQKQLDKTTPARDNRDSGMKAVQQAAAQRHIDHTVFITNGYRVTRQALVTKSDHDLRL